jgi:hypothetical protein
MTQKRKTKRNGADHSPTFSKQAFTNDLGIPQVVLVPPGETDLTTGIPVSLDLTPLYGGLSEDFQQRLYKALHARGLVEPVDYFKSGAAERFRAAMLSAIKQDFYSVQALAKQELNNG